MIPKNLFRYSNQFAVALLLALGTNRAAAQIVASDNASTYNTWTNGENSGFGFQPWQLVNTNGSGTFSGFFIDGNSLNISTSGKTFAMYANGANAPFAFAYRGFSNALAASEGFKVKFQNTSINTANPGYMGFCLRNNGATNFTASSVIGDSGTRFAFYFVGGQTDYFIWDGNGATDSGIPFTFNGLSLEFYLLTADTYELVVKTADGSTTLASFPSASLAGIAGSSITNFVGFNLNSGQNENAYFNSLQIASVSVVPPAIVNLSPTNGQIYAPTPGNFSFEVTSLFSTISSNGISLVLNGVNQSNHLSFTGSGTADLLVTNTAPLQGNTIYTGAIIATDANGNHTTNNFTFNTWLAAPANIFIESGDYNYNGGQWLDNMNPANPQPNQTLGQFDLLGSNTVDYLEYDLTGTNHPNFYRTNDLPQIELATDVDHDDFANNGFFDYDLGFIESGEWEDYTRHLSNNVTYAVYARMAGFGNSPTMLMERMATPQVNSTNQPRAALGTFVCPFTGGAQNWTFVQLKDFFSNPVLVNFPGTNTFRLTDIGGSGSYNVNYLILVALTNTAMLRPYLAAGYPFPNAGPLQPDATNISFTIANRQTSVTSVQMFLNSNNVTGSTTISNNAAGTVVNYSSPTYLPGGTNTLQVVFSDGAVTQTNSWQFTVVALPTLSAAWALPSSFATNRGFSLQIAKGDDSATNADFPALISRAEAQLAGALTNSQTGQPYANEAFNGGNYTETNGINYAIDPLFYGFTAAFPSTNAFSDLPAGGTNNVAMAATMYVQLSAGICQLGVFSDDGFKFTAGPTAGSTNLTLGIFDGGRGGSETAFSFIVPTNGLYPMRLLYYKAQRGGGGVQLYTIDRTTGIRILLNNPSNINALPVFQTSTNASVLTPPTPRITGIGLSGATLTITATNGAVNGRYVLLQSTNVALPLSQWTPVLTNNFNGSGSLNLTTNIVNPSNPREFYILLQ